MYVTEYAYTWMQLCMCIYVWVHVHVHVHAYTHKNIMCRYESAPVCVCIGMVASMCVRGNMSINRSINQQEHTYVFIHLYMYMCRCMLKYGCICIYEGRIEKYQSAGAYVRVYSLIHVHVQVYVKVWVHLYLRGTYREVSISRSICTCILTYACTCAGVC